MYQRVHFEIEGIAPLLLHNGRLADPLDEYARELKSISGKKKKTDQDYEAMGRIEFLGSFYIDESKRPVIPGENIEAAFVEAAKKIKLGTQSKAAILSDGAWPILYEGSKKLEELWSDKRFVDRRRVVVGTASVMRTRPIFRKWSLGFDIDYLPDQLNQSQIVEIVTIMGRIIGLCDFTPKFGRFNVVKAAGIKLAA